MDPAGTFALTPHPDSRCPAVARLEVEVARSAAGGLSLRYVLAGRSADLRMPPATPPARVDGLWRHSCFEAFVAAGPGEGYYEFNLSPSTQWAAWRFDGYRSGMAVAEGLAAPRIEFRSQEGGCELAARLDLDSLAGLPADAAWRVGLSAVIEDAGGGLSYWALAHPPGAPDFHHSDCFALELVPACRS